MLGLDETNSPLKWTAEPIGWFIALLVGLWGAMVGIEEWLVAICSIALVAVLTVVLFSRKFIQYRNKSKQLARLFLGAALITLAVAALFGFVTYKAYKRTREKDASLIGINKQLSTIDERTRSSNLILLSQLVEARKHDDQIEVATSVVVCTQLADDCDHLDRDERSWTVPVNVPKGRKLVEAWCVAIDNFKDEVAFQFVKADIKDDKGSVQLTARRAQPVVGGRVRYAIYIKTQPV